MTRIVEEPVELQNTALGTRHGNLVVSYLKDDFVSRLPDGSSLVRYEVRQSTDGKCIAVATIEESEQ